MQIIKYLKYLKYVNLHLHLLEILLLIFLVVFTWHQNKAVIEANRIAENSFSLADQVYKEMQNQSKILNNTNQTTQGMAELEKSKTSLKIEATLTLSKPERLFAEIGATQQGIKFNIIDWSNLNNDVKLYLSVKNESSIELNGEITSVRLFSKTRYCKLLI